MRAAPGCRLRLRWTASFGAKRTVLFRICLLCAFPYLTLTGTLMACRLRGSEMAQVKMSWRAYEVRTNLFGASRGCGL